MFIFAELFRSMAYLVNGIYMILFWLLMARIVISWFPVDPYHNIVQFLVQITDPLLRPFRRLPLQIGMIDLTPLVAFVVLHFLREVLMAFFLTIAAQFSSPNPAF